MKYDDAEYYFLNFETDLDNDAANTYIGQYLAWAILNDLASTDPGLGDGWLASHAALRARRTTPGEVLATFCDCKLTSDDLNTQGNAFTAWYYAERYATDYERTMAALMPDTGHPTDDFCSVPDTWASYDLLAPMLDRRLAEWKADHGGGDPPANDPAPTTTPPTSATAGKPELSLEPLDTDEPPPAVPSADARDALRALRQRAEGGDREAWFDLAAAYLTGQDVPQDFAQAAMALEKAARLGQVDAQYNLGVCFQRGDGKPKDLQQALRWWGMAAEAGHADALFMLGQAYRNGAGVPKDFVASNALMLYARRRGSRDAINAGVMSGSVGESMALYERLREPGQLIAVLAARRRGLADGTVDGGVDAWTRGEPLAASSANSATTRATPGSAPTPKPARRAAPAADSTRPGVSHVALLIGAISTFVLLLMAGGNVADGTFRTTAVVLGLIGAWGSASVSGTVGAGLPTRVLLAILSALPFVGSFVCIAVLLRWVRVRNGD